MNYLKVLSIYLHKRTKMTLHTALILSSSVILHQLDNKLTF